MSETNLTDAATQPENDGFNVVNEVHRSAWPDQETEHQCGEFVHVIVDQENQELRCYLSMVDDYPNERAKTIIPNVKSTLRYREGNEKTLRGFYLTWKQAESFMSFVDLVSQTRLEATNPVRLTWYENNEKPAHEDEDVNHETITLDWTKGNGAERSIQISDTYSLVDEPGLQSSLNQMAKYEDDQ